MNYYHDDDLKKAKVIWLVLGYVLGMLAGGGSSYFMYKEKLATANATSESMAQELRLCEEQLDSKR